MKISGMQLDIVWEDKRANFAKVSEALNALFAGFSTVYHPNGPSCAGSLRNSVISSSSFHTGGAMHTWNDGSVHFLSETMDRRTYQQLGMKNDGEVLVNSDF